MIPSKTKVIFSHGKESGPWGSKIKRLAAVASERGYPLESIDYQDTHDPAERVARLLKYVEKEQGDFLLVGSSMGGYVAAVAAESCNPQGVFMMAPALFVPGYPHQHQALKCGHVHIVHGWSDEVIPWELSMKYARQTDCQLHLISGDHGLNNVLDDVVSQFEIFLDCCER